MNDETTMAARRCGIDEVFPGPFIELIGLAPRNPVVRGLILAQTGKMPGSDHETFEQIKEWVETTCDKRVPLPQMRSQWGQGVVVDVQFSDTEYGRAKYSVPRSGSDEFRLDADELLDLAQAAADSGAGLDGLIEKAAALIDEEGWERCEPGLEATGDFEYEEHDETDSENATIEFSRSQLRDRLLVFLRNGHADLLEALL
jgi:hypothetical protein